jgi:hypothetical protein
MLLGAMCWTGRVAGQDMLPLSTQYPGGHTGLRGGATPAVGGAVINYNRLYEVHRAVSASGDTVDIGQKTVYANINIFSYVTPFKLLGMNYGGMVVFPFNDVYNRPTGSDRDVSGFGLGNVAIIPLLFYGKSKYFDYQWGAGPWVPSGEFHEGGDQNHGSGFLTMIYSIAGMYYPGGNRESWSISGVLRMEQNFKQKDTGLRPGSAMTTDWGIGKLLVLGKKKRNVIDVGLTGFAQWQITEESNAPSTVDTTRYRAFALGAELDYMIPGKRVGFKVRYNQEFAARNTTLGGTLWVAIAYTFPWRAAAGKFASPSKYQEECGNRVTADR